MTVGAGHCREQATDGCRLRQRAGRRSVVCRWVVQLFLAMGGSILSQGTVLAIDVEQVQWGFDGQVVSNRFNLLSVLISNDSPQPFDGDVILRKAVGPRRVDAPLVETLYLAPHSRRWVQFHPYTIRDWEQWTISWDVPVHGDYDLPNPRHGDRACVLLEEADTLSTGGGAIRRFPEQLFPVSQSAMDGLQSVVLDHVPRWEEGRQRSLVDWLKHGGIVHILQMPRDEFPRFEGILEPLNTVARRQRVGAGYVIRHERQRRQLDNRYVEQVLVPARDPGVVTSAETTALATSMDRQQEQQQYIYTRLWEGDDLLFTALKQMSSPRHSWVLIHLLCLVYLWLIFPGGFVLAQKRAGDYRIVFGALGLIVALFSGVFLYVGRRGYGERTSLDAVALARFRSDGTYDVSQFSNAFVVDGGDYTFGHAGTGRVYSTCQDEEAVHGQIRSGVEARFTADIPPYSSRSFGQRMISPGPPLPVTVEAWQSNLIPISQNTNRRDLSLAMRDRGVERVLERLTLRKGPAFPQKIDQPHVVCGRRVYTLADSADKLELAAEVGPMVTFLQVDGMNRYTQYFDQWTGNDETVDKVYSKLFVPLAARACEVTTHRDALEFELPDDRIRLLLYVPLPDEFHARSEQFANQRGRALLCLDLFPADR